VIDPKAVTADELFGTLNASKEFKNGVLSSIIRNQCKNFGKYKPIHKHKWSILDGDIDPEWIESLNTVMDDNKVLTLVSNDRFPLTASMRLLFEISNLRNATPATVSRAGVLFINDTDIGWKPYFEAWMESHKKAEIDLLKNSETKCIMRPEFNNIAESVLLKCAVSLENVELLRMIHVCPMVDIAMVQTTCTILDAVILENEEKIKLMKEDE
jgi:dynein heavy chain, axonemal